ncbi:MAG: nitroreductase family protein [Bacteroidales bacterium]|nr:nitroreductase family protein [Bacteroidales bacterium]
MAKKSFLDKLSDLTKIQHRAAFTNVDKHISQLNFETHFAELAAARYSCRSFSDRELNPDKVNKILDVARLAPTAANRQPVHVWAVTGADALERLHKVHAAFNAPAVFMIGAKADEAWIRGYDNKNGAETDAAIVATHIMLEAADLGLGNIWIGSYDPAKIADVFPETAGYEITALIAVGHPADDAGPGPKHEARKALGEFATVL